MCRLFGMSAGEESVAATFWLLDAPDSLSEQSHRNADGTGIGYFDAGGEPHVEKQPIAAYDDREFASQARTIRSRTFVAHIRHATAGGLTMANTHPFCQRGRLFAHNGVIEDLPTLEQRLGDARALVAGETDSERYFALITSEIDRHHGDVEAGIRAAVTWIAQTLPVVSINFVLVTATDLWALRYPETDTLYVLDRPAGGEGPDVAAPLDHTSSYGTRVHAEPARNHSLVLVASERMDGDPAWREVRSGELLHAGPSLKLEAQLLSLPPHP
ncbi:MAG: class II glutamine amidotransferase [Actinomycetota bacterium]|nr:class II glutamine amidotransferase [Actinomycetota bacterium]